MKMKTHPISVQRSDTILSIFFTGICAASTGFITTFLSAKFYIGIVIHQDYTDYTAAQPNLWLFYISATTAALVVRLFMW